MSSFLALCHMSLNLSENGSGNDLNNDDSNGRMVCTTPPPKELDDDEECTKKEVSSKGKGTRNETSKKRTTAFSHNDDQCSVVDTMLGIGEHNNYDVQLLLKQQQRQNITSVGSWLNHKISSQGRGLDCKWYQILEDHFTDYTPREGHLAWLLGSNEERKICINGGFTKDDTVYMLQCPTASSSGSSSPSSLQTPWTWTKIIPKVKSENFLRFVYGSTITTLDSTRAIRFGGFTAGLYRGEKTELALLTIRSKDKKNKGEDSFGNQYYEPMDCQNNREKQNGEQYEAEWEVINTTNEKYTAVGRAYHTSTLLLGRYLVIIGGMQSDQSILSESILDTQTWTWIEQQITTSSTLPTSTDGIGSGSDSSSSNSSSNNSSSFRIDESDRGGDDDGNQQPSARHGHSVILDSRRNRLVLFGGGNGSDLLRDGIDNSEVWELNMGDNWQTDFIGSLPWKWKNLHDDVVSEQQRGTKAGANNTVGGTTIPTTTVEDRDPVESFSAGDFDRWSADSATSPTSSSTTVASICNKLSPAEALCLGRCHNAIQVSGDTVIFVFGSGRPPTNGILAYDLRNDSFFRPQVHGPIPRPRHAGIGIFLQEEGYVFLSGGYTIKEGAAVGDTSILDLAPGMKNRRPFDKLPIDPISTSFEPTTTEDALSDRYFGKMDSALVSSFCKYH